MHSSGGAPMLLGVVDLNIKDHVRKGRGPAGLAMAL